MPIRIQRRRTKGWRAEDHSTAEYGYRYVGRGTRWGNPWVVAQTRTGWAVNWAGEGTPTPETGGGVGVWPNELEARRYATEAYRVWITQPEQAEQLRLFRALLHGRDLMCWCPLPTPGEPDHCHAAVILDLANRLS